MRVRILSSLRFAGVCSVALAAFAGASANAQDAAACAAMRTVTLPGAALEITAAERVPAGNAPAAGPGGPSYAGALPAHCRIDGVLERRKGVAGVEYGIRFALALPDNWTGRFLFQGGGGLNGTVNPPLGAGAAGDAPALARGFAVVSTDTGHQGVVFDGSFFADQEATLNFLYVANGKVTQVAKRLIDAYYRKPAEHSYFVGCSTGGREAMIMSQRYPSYFDGLVSGAPAMRTGYSNLGMRSVSVALSKAAARDASGAVIPGSALSDGDKKLIIDSLLKTCDADDGVADGMIFNPRACGFDPMSLVCKGAKSATCLSSVQAAAVKTALAGPKASNGRQVYPGYLYDTGITFGGQGIPGVLNGAPSPVGPRVPPTAQNVDDEVAAVLAAPNTLGDTNQWTSLSTFVGHGGKLLFYHGASDPWFSALDTIDYYRTLGEANGGADQVKAWSRLFLVPGMGHCAGGTATLDRFDMLSAIVDWVETAKAPESVIATGTAFPGRSRPLCPYPQHAHYTGRGNSEDATNFQCR
ncbi:MAG: tannase/feruloyl esterase family alpha/beta hydrolase [Gammaproteobacteria bacterium]